MSGVVRMNSLWNGTEQGQPLLPTGGSELFFRLVKGPSGMMGLAPRTNRAGGRIGKVLHCNKPQSDFRWQVADAIYPEKHQVCEQIQSPR